MKIPSAGNSIHHCSTYDVGSPAAKALLRLFVHSCKGFFFEAQEDRKKVLTIPGTIWDDCPRRVEVKRRRHGEGFKRQVPQHAMAPLCALMGHLRLVNSPQKSIPKTNDFGLILGS